MSLTSRKESVKFTTKGQVVIPAWMRAEFGIKEGTRAVAISQPDGILLKPLTSTLIKRGRGILKRPAGSKSLAGDWAEHKRQEREIEDRHAK